MPPVLGPVSPSPMRLWSCAIGSGAGDRAVAQRHQAALGAGEPLLEHDRALRHQLADGGLGAPSVAVGHDDALAGGETVELDDDRLAELAPPGDGLLGDRTTGGTPATAGPGDRPACG